MLSSWCRNVSKFYGQYPLYSLAYCFSMFFRYFQCPSWLFFCGEDFQMQHQHCKSLLFSVAVQHCSFLLNYVNQLAETLRVLCGLDVVNTFIQVSMSISFSTARTKLSSTMGRPIFGKEFSWFDLFLLLDVADVHQPLLPACIDTFFWS